MKSLIIIEHEPLTVRLKKIWNIDALRMRGVHVEYWDISQYLYPSAEIPRIVEDPSVIQIEDLSALEKHLSQVDVTRIVFVVEFFPNWDNRNLVLLLHKYKCKCVKIDLYANTMLSCSFIGNFLLRFRRFSYKKLLKKLAWHYFLRFHSIQMYNKILSSSGLVKPDIRINHPDYEEFLLLDESKPNINMPYLLFVDNYFPLHPDLKRLSSNIVVDAKKYQLLMREFFDFLEQRYKKKVVIAAHPKAMYSGKEFGDRKILWGQTGNLIKYADMVIMNGSNSLSYIALADKPFIIVYPDTYKMYPYLYKYVKDLASYCKKEAYNLNSCDWDKIQFEKLNAEWRKIYISTFIASEETSRRKNVDIWVDELLKEVV